MLKGEVVAHEAPAYTLFLNNKPVLRQQSFPRNSPLLFVIPSEARNLQFSGAFLEMF